MQVKRAHHVSFTVADLERARGFYEKLLGLAPIERPDFGFPGAWYQAGDVQVHLIERPADPDADAAPGPNPLENHVAFEIDDYAAVHADLLARGLPVAGLGPEMGQMFLRDPDRNVIELIDPKGRPGRPR